MDILKKSFIIPAFASSHNKMFMMMLTLSSYGRDYLIILTFFINLLSYRPYLIALLRDNIHFSEKKELPLPAWGV